MAKNEYGYVADIKTLSKFTKGYNGALYTLDQLQSYFKMVENKEDNEELKTFINNLVKF